MLRIKNALHANRSAAANLIILFSTQVCGIELDVQFQLLMVKNTIYFATALSQLTVTFPLYTLYFTVSMLW